MSPFTGRDLVRLPSGGALTVEGPADAAPVLLLHGVGGGAWSWRPQRLALSGTYRVYAWEARGHGAAAPVTDAGLSDYETDAREALAAIVASSGTPAVVAGHSMGGLLAITLAADPATAPSIRGIFLVDPVFAGTSSESYGHFSPRVGRIVRVLCTPLIESFARNGVVARRIGRWMFERSFEDRVRMEAAWRDQRLQVPVEYRRMLSESFTGPTGFVARDPDGITVPVMIVEGSSARSGPRFPRLVDGLRSRLGERFEYAMVPGGHYLQLDRPAEVTALLRRFVQRALA